MPRKHKDKPYKHWDPEEEDDEDPIWDEEDELDDYEFEGQGTVHKPNKQNEPTTTKVSENRSRRPG